MALMTRNRVKLLLTVFMAGGVLHLMFDKGQSIYENFDRISTYLDEDPLSKVLANTVNHQQQENESTLPYFSSSAYTSIPLELSQMLYGNDTGEAGEWGNTSFPFAFQDPKLKRCPEMPPSLVGPIRVWMDSPSFDSLEKLYSYLQPGGHGQPKECRSRHKVAIVVPYRDRESHLRIMLHNLHSFLTKQQLDYAILMNVGFAEAMKLYPWECFIFHDVDLLPEDDRNLYSCPTIPRHMSVAVDKFNYKLPYSSIFGGISAMTVEQLHSINGFSNKYWGWGGEDDDLANRVSAAGYKIARYPAKIARYKMIKHVHEAKTNPINKCRYKLMAKTTKVYKKDGLSSLKYDVVRLELLPLYTHIVVDLLEEKERPAIRKQMGC
ncbi:hypothetical protein Q1695_009684 [Nippostrongylus brasiliensis]|nr:hypothetical protein Q1695_009684 [Nippostrongylus brasiliensis]